MCNFIEKNSYEKHIDRLLANIRTLKYLILFRLKQVIILAFKYYSPFLVFDLIYKPLYSKPIKSVNSF